MLLWIPIILLSFIVVLGILKLCGKYPFQKYIKLTDLVQQISMVILVGVTAFYASETSKSVKVSEKMASQMEHANRVNLRPYLMIKPGNPEYSEDGKLIFPIELINVGNATARNARKHHKLFEVIRATGKTNCLKSWMEPDDKRTVVFPKQEQSMLVKHREDLGKNVIKQNEVDKKYFRVQFIITYEGLKHVDDNEYYTLVIFELYPSKVEEEVVKQFKVTIPPKMDEGIVDKGARNKRLEICEEIENL